MIVFEELIRKVDKKIIDEKIFKEIDDIESFYSKKILDTFKKHMVSETDFHGTTGYGYNDLGRDTVEAIYKDVFNFFLSFGSVQFNIVSIFSISYIYW